MAVTLEKSWVVFFTHMCGMGPSHQCLLEDAVESEEKSGHGKPVTGKRGAWLGLRFCVAVIAAWDQKENVWGAASRVAGRWGRSQLKITLILPTSAVRLSDHLKHGNSDFQLLFHGGTHNEVEFGSRSPGRRGCPVPSPSPAGCSEDHWRSPIFS